MYKQFVSSNGECKSCVHNGICKYKEEKSEMEKQIEEIGNVGLLSPVKAVVQCREYKCGAGFR